MISKEAANAILEDMEKALTGFKTVESNTVMVWLENILTLLTCENEPCKNCGSTERIVVCNGCYHLPKEGK